MSLPAGDAAPQPRVSRSDVASGAALTALARMGALIEIVTQPAFVWMFGLATYGLYIVLWAAVNVISTLMALSLPQALQRVVPAAQSEEEAHGAVRYALLVGTLPAIGIALPISLTAPLIAPLFSASPAMREALPSIIALFVWAMPLWILLDIATAAARARRAFGPEIRLRIFWEQIVRLIAAVVLFALGARLFGLFAAHLLSLAVTSVLSVRLLGRYYDLALLWRAPMPAAMRHDLLKSGFAILPPELARRAFNDLPPVLLNVALSGTAGAVAAGLFGIARKLASVPLIVRQTFLYVLAPLSAEQKAHDPAALAPLYRFSNRIAAALVLPLAALMITTGDVLLMLFSPAAAAALSMLVILLIGRVGETILGAATPIVEMTGHRGLPLINSLAGLALAAIIGWLTVPTLGATGMAIAVSAGVVLASWAAVGELWISDGLNPFDRHFLLAIGLGLSALPVLYGVGLMLGSAPAPLRALAQFAAFWPLLWISLRLSLDHDDKAALGRWSARLRL